MASRLAVAAATPSMKPATGKGVCSTDTRKMMRIGTIISLAMSVKKLTRPRT